MKKLQISKGRQLLIGLNLEKVKVHNDKGQYVSVSVELPEYGGAWPIG